MTRLFGCCLHSPCQHPLLLPSPASVYSGRRDSRRGQRPWNLGYNVGAPRRDPPAFRLSGCQAAASPKSTVCSSR
ncbi:hypothetical protein BS78_01G003300 [Paspalum vaginatum]|nr:hypothetical protein BS78_01G003300 [Paspalum vaginatum]